MKGYSCKRCEKRKFYTIRRGKKRCRNCDYEFKIKLGNLNLTKNEWKKIIFWFLLEQPIRGIEKQTGVSHYSITKAATVLRIIITKDIPPEIFSGTVEIDETYLGGQKKNKNKQQLLKEERIFGKESKRGFGTTKQPIFGILARSGKVFAKLVDDTKAKDLIPIITKKVERGTRICSDTYNSYTGLAAKGYVHRTVEHGNKEYVKGKNHINGLEGFWGYLKRKLAAKGGVKRKYLHLFLGEYVWRYNYRPMPLHSNETIETGETS